MPGEALSGSAPPLPPNDSHPDRGRGGTAGLASGRAAVGVRGALFELLFICSNARKAFARDRASSLPPVPVEALGTFVYRLAPLEGVEAYAGRGWVREGGGGKLEVAWYGFLEGTPGL